MSQHPISTKCQYGRSVMYCAPQTGLERCTRRALPDGLYCAEHHAEAMARVPLAKQRVHVLCESERRSHVLETP